jgi:hypothetical protein
MKHICPKANECDRYSCVHKIPHEFNIGCDELCVEHNDSGICIIQCDEFINEDDFKV